MPAVLPRNSEPVEEAGQWARRLIDREQAKTGVSIRDSARLVARRVRSTTSALLTLIYQPPKDIGACLYEALRQAVEDAINHDIRALQDELVRARSLGLVLAHGSIAEIEADLARLRARLNGDADA